MANSILAARSDCKVGKNWASNFVKRHPELRTFFNRRKHDYQRAKNKDPKVIEDWFKRVHNIKEEYGILDDDIYTFDERAFQMGDISTQIVVTGQKNAIIRNQSC